MKREKKYLAGFIIILVAALAVVAATYILKKQESDKSKAVPAPQISSSQTVSPEASATLVESNKLEDWHVYQNSDYGFRLTFTDIWKGYEAETTKTPKPQVAASVAFKLKTSDEKYTSSSGFAVPLTIYVYKEKDYNDETKSLFPQTQLLSCEGYIYAYSTWEEPASDLQGLTEKSIADILKGFETSCTK